MDRCPFDDTTAPDRSDFLELSALGVEVADVRCRFFVSRSLCDIFDRSTTEPVSGERNYDRLGITVQPVPEDFVSARRVGDEYRRGLLVTQVSARGPAYRELLANRDIILRTLHPVRREIRSASDLEQVVRSLKRGDDLTLIVYDAGVGSTKVVTLAIN